MSNLWMFSAQKRTGCSKRPKRCTCWANGIYPSWNSLSSLLASHAWSSMLIQTSMCRQECRKLRLLGFCSGHCICNLGSISGVLDHSTIFGCISSFPWLASRRKGVRESRWGKAIGSRTLKRHGKWFCYGPEAHRGWICLPNYQIHPWVPCFLRNHFDYLLR